MAHTTCLPSDTQAFAEELQLAAGVQPHSVTQAYDKGANGSEEHEAALEEGAAKVAAGLAKLERDMLDKITKPLGALPGALIRV